MNHHPPGSGRDPQCLLPNYFTESNTGDWPLLEGDLFFDASWRSEARQRCLAGSLLTCSSRQTTKTHRELNLDDT